MHTTETLDVPASTEGLRLAEEGLDEFSAAHGLTRNDTWPFHVAIEEVLSNVVRYGRPPANGRVQIQLFLEAETLEMIILDDAQAFNSLEPDRPDTVTGREERDEGGLGIEIVRRLMDAIEYERVGARHNRLALRRRLGL